MSPERTGRELGCSTAGWRAAAAARGRARRARRRAARGRAWCGARPAPSRRAPGTGSVFSSRPRTGSRAVGELDGAVRGRRPASTTPRRPRQRRRRSPPRPPRRGARARAAGPEPASGSSRGRRRSRARAARAARGRPPASAARSAAATSAIAAEHAADHGGGDQPAGATDRECVAGSRGAPGCGTGLRRERSEGRRRESIAERRPGRRRRDGAGRPRERSPSAGGGGAMRGPCAGRQPSVTQSERVLDPEHAAAAACPTRRSTTSTYGDEARRDADAASRSHGSRVEVHLDHRRDRVAVAGPPPERTTS